MDSVYWMQTLKLRANRSMVLSTYISMKTWNLKEGIMGYYNQLNHMQP